MKLNKKYILIVLGVILFLFVGLVVYIYIQQLASSDPRVEKVNLPDGFKIDLVTDQVEGARSMALASDGTVYVGTRSAGRIYAVRDLNGDYIDNDVVTVKDGLYVPNGVVYHEGDLYVAEQNRVIKFSDIDWKNDLGNPEVVNDDFPNENAHGWKYMALGPDNKLYISVGAPCNICENEDERFAAISRMNLDGSEKEVYVSGVRNTVGFDWQPGTDELWFTDNGRDWLGDDLPPDELNRVTEPGQHFGYPYCHGEDIQDPEFGTGIDCRGYEKPVQKLGPHVAALGIKFYTGVMFPERYHGAAFIAEHGSWNRTIPIGYRISMVRLNEAQESQGYEIFADGWLQGLVPWGRPVDILQLLDGSLLVSDDKAGSIYRISYEE